MVTRLIVDIKDPLLDFLVNFLSSVDEGLSKKMQQCLVQTKINTERFNNTFVFFQLGAIPERYQSYNLD